MLSHFLAQYMGIFLIVFCLYVFLRRDHLRGALEEVVDCPSLQIVWAIVPFAFGLFVMIVHQFWIDSVAVLVTLVGWAVFLTGFIRLYFPEFAYQLSLKLLEGVGSYITAGIGLIVGIILTWWGFE